jgi:hypothetical protein
MRSPTEAEITLQALLNLWDKLPELFGPAWVEVYPRLEALSTRLL